MNHTRSGLLMLAVLSIALPTALRAQRSWPVDLQITATNSSIRQRLVPAGGVVEGTSIGLRGYEASLIGPSSGFGLYGRYGTGGTGNGRQLLEGRIMMGAPQFRLEFGYAERRHSVLDSTFQYFRGGFTTTTTLGTSGVAIRFRAIGTAPIKREGLAFQQHLGWEGETNVSYTWPRLPVFAQVGYRIESMRHPGGDEELSSLVLGLGVWLKP